MINLDKCYKYNYVKLKNMSVAEVRNEKDLYHVKLCIIYLTREMLVTSKYSDIKELSDLRIKFQEKYDRYEDTYKLQEKFIADIESYTTRALPTMRPIKSDRIFESGLQIFLLLMLTVITILFAFYNRDLANIYVGVEFVVLLMYLYYGLTGKRVLLLSLLRAVIMIGDADRVKRDLIWIDSFKNLIPESHSAYILVQGLTTNFTSRYTAELLHEKYIQVERRKK